MKRMIKITWKEQQDRGARESMTRRRVTARKNHKEQHHMIMIARREQQDCGTKESTMNRRIMARKNH
jgi:hypothetical protein